jgi:signal transduction histidine kinase
MESLKLSPVRAASGSLADVVLHGRARPSALYLARVAAVAVVYFLAARLGLSLAFIAEQISPVWPPTGFALAVVYLWGPQMWPGLILGAFAINTLPDSAGYAAFGIATGNTLEALVGAWVLRRAGFEAAFERVRDVLALIAAALLSTPISASFGVVSLCWVGAQSWSAFPELWWTWWVGDAGGDWVVAPLLLACAARPRALLGELRAAPLGEVVSLGLATTALGAWIFASPADPERIFRQEYMLFLPVIWAALRSGVPVVCGLTAISAALAVFGTVRGLGPFATDSTNQSLLTVQVFLWTLSGAGLLLASSMGERRRLEDDLRAHAGHQAEEHRRKDEFLAMLGHELRNPLMPIGIGVELLREKGGDPSLVTSTAALIERQLRHMVRLVDDLLDVSRITRSKIELRKESIDLREAIEDAIELNRSLIESRGHELTVMLPAEPLRMEADAVRLTQVVSNLVQNAAKYTPPRGAISVAARREGGRMVVEVCDNGPGMSEELQQQAFELFVQGERGLQRTQGGLGGGLTLARALVELHGGRIAAHSGGPGKGTAMTILLPVH